MPPPGLTQLAGKHLGCRRHYGCLFRADNDGRLDILIGSDYPNTRLFLFRQQEGGRFTDISAEAGLDQPWPAGLALADFDQDGDIDVVTGSSTARSGTPWEKGCTSTRTWRVEIREPRPRRGQLNRRGIGAEFES